MIIPTSRYRAGILRRALQHGVERSTAFLYTYGAIFSARSERLRRLSPIIHIEYISAHSVGECAVNGHMLLTSHLKLNVVRYFGPVEIIGP